MKKSKIAVIVCSMVAALFVSCGSTGVSDSDPNVNKGVSAWNSRNPEAARAYWTEIEDSTKQKKWLGNITLYNAGVKALDSTDSIKSTNESALNKACNTALTKFSAIDSNLKLPADVRDKGATLTAGRVDKLLASEKNAEAKKMYNSAVKVYGTNSDLEEAGKEVDVVNIISAKKNTLLALAKEAGEKETFDEKVAAYDAAIAKYPAAEAEVNAAVNQSTVKTKAGVTANQKAFKKVRQDIQIQRSAAFRDQAYTYRDRMGEEFARQPAEGSGSGKDGSLTVYDIRKHYQSVKENMDSIYSELEDFASKYPKDVGTDVIADAQAQKNDLNNKIAQINQEIAVKEEIESRGKTVMPLMIGLFNSDPSARGSKSRPAKFSATNQTKNEYWWGMVSIPKGKMNDVVIKMKDNRTVRVFNENTHSGKDIEKKGMKDLINQANKVGNQWPILNAGAQLTTGKYFIEVQKGKTNSYSGEVVVYNSFVTRSR